jgi:hypothetical protein
MKVGMSKKKSTHIHVIFAELSHLSAGECMHHRWATPTAELGSHNRDGVGARGKARDLESWNPKES